VLLSAHGAVCVCVPECVQRALLSLYEWRRRLLRVLQQARLRSQVRKEREQGRIRSRRANTLGREGLAILALRKLHRQSSLCGTGPARDRWQPWKAAHGMCSPLPGSITSAQARHALTACGSARAGEGGVRREPRPSLSVKPSTPCWPKPNT
jgi:hypothetical protein